MVLTLVGHSTVVIELDSGRVIVTDPWFQPVSATRSLPPALGPADIPRCDLVLVSHGHRDHYDRETARFCRERRALLACPPAVARSAVRSRAGTVQAITPGDRIEAGWAVITAIPAVHPLARGPVGFLVEAERSLYFSGDTRFDAGIAAALAHRRVDVAVVQASCGRYMGIEFGMNLEGAVKLVRQIEPGLAIPVHYHARRKVIDPQSFLEKVPPPLGLVLEPGKPTPV